MAARNESRTRTVGEISSTRDAVTCSKVGPCERRNTYRGPVNGRAARGIAVAFTVPWLLWAAVRVFGWDAGYPLVPAISFTPYVALSSVLPVAGGVLVRSRTAIVLALVAVTAFAVVLLPRGLAGSPPAAGAGPVLRVASINLFFGQADAGAVVDLVDAREIDVLAVQELTPDALERLLYSGIDDRLPFQLVTPEARSAGGGGLFSRYPLTEPGAVEALFRQPQATIDVPDAPAVVVTSVHAFPPARSPESVRQWATDLATLPPARSAEELPLLIGDFNATLDHRALRDVLDTGYADAASLVGQGLTPTWSGSASLPGLAIDHVLVPGPVAVESFELAAVPETDHRFVIAVLRLPCLIDDLP